MRVAVNGIALLSPLTGIGQYTYHLVKGLQSTPGCDVDLFYGTGWSKELRTTPAAGISGLKSLVKRVVPNPYAVSRFVMQRTFSAGVRAGRPDVYHEPNFLAYACSAHTVITVHDLSWIRYPHTHPIERVRAMNKYFEPGLRRAALILTDSQFVKREVIEVFGVKPELIISVPLGVEPLFHPRSADETLPVLTRHKLQHGRYLLAVGTLEPRKNLQVALQAFMRLPPATRKQYPLVLVGMSGWHTSALEAQMAPMIQAGELRQLGYVSRPDLAAVIAGAVTLIYPSVYEGFGLPPLEAMACAVPVIASNVSSLPEVVGNTGVLVSPHDERTVADAIEKFIDDPALRDKMAAQALTRSKGFTWEKCVAQTMSAYQQVRNG
jgi:alpha-1,3-rhamnosyl/mannosyltransferase